MVGEKWRYDRRRRKRLQAALIGTTTAQNTRQPPRGSKRAVDLGVAEACNPPAAPSVCSDQGHGLSPTYRPDDIVKVCPPNRLQKRGQWRAHDLVVVLVDGDRGARLHPAQEVHALSGVHGDGGGQDPSAAEVHHCHIDVRIALR
jgi:hypothetical protein